MGSGSGMFSGVHLANHLPYAVLLLACWRSSRSLAVSTNIFKHLIGCPNSLLGKWLQNVVLGAYILYYCTTRAYKCWKRKANVSGGLNMQWEVCNCWRSTWVCYIHSYQYNQSTSCLLGTPLSSLIFRCSSPVKYIYHHYPYNPLYVCIEEHSVMVLLQITRPNNQQHFVDVEDVKMKQRFA